MDAVVTITAVTGPSVTSGVLCREVSGSNPGAASLRNCLLCQKTVRVIAYTWDQPI